MGDTHYQICGTTINGEYRSCEKHDPPIMNTEHCAEMVKRLIMAGVCHPNGMFVSDGCDKIPNGQIHLGYGGRCACQRRDRAAPTLESSLYSSLYKLKGSEGIVQHMTFNSNPQGRCGEGYYEKFAQYTYLLPASPGLDCCTGCPSVIGLENKYWCDVNCQCLCLEDSTSDADAVTTTRRNPKSRRAQRRAEMKRRR